MHQFPDSVIAREAQSLLRATSRPALINHSLRSYLWAVELAQIDRVSYDPEVLFVAAALHDLGLEEQFDSGIAFELDGARVARDLALSHGWSAGRVRAAEAAVALHMEPYIAQDEGAAYLLWHATGLDVSGQRLHEMSDHVAAQVLDDHPWLDFTEQFSGLLARQVNSKPRSGRAPDLVGEGLLQRLAACPLGRGPDGSSSLARPSTLPRDHGLAAEPTHPRPEVRR